MAGGIATPGRTGKSEHCIELINREKLSVGGVEDVLNFDEGGVVLQTSAGVLSIEGANLHITNLNVEAGEVEIEGTINGFFYPQAQTKKSSGLLQRFLKVK